MVAAEVETSFAKNLESTLSDDETQAILEIFEKISIRPWLIQNPFKRIKLVDRSYLLGFEVNGWYSYEDQETEIGISKNRQEWGKSLDWGNIEAVSHVGRTALEAVRFTVLHELGHHLHATLLQTNPFQFQLSLRFPRTNAISSYAKIRGRPEEYFALKLRSL